jgi:hypothetical protein
MIWPKKLNTLSWFGIIRKEKNHKFTISKVNSVIVVNISPIKLEIKISNTILLVVGI